MATTPFLPSLTTRAARAGGEPDPTTGAVTPPIVQSTTFRQPGIGRHLGYTYSRADNPTVAALERCLGALEDAPPAVAFASGLAAETALFLATCAHGDHVVVSDVVSPRFRRLPRRFPNVLSSPSSSPLGLVVSLLVSPRFCRLPRRLPSFFSSPSSSPSSFPLVWEGGETIGRAGETFGRAGGDDWGDEFGRGRRLGGRCRAGETIGGTGETIGKTIGPSCPVGPLTGSEPY